MLFVPKLSKRSNEKRLIKLNNSLYRDTTSCIAKGINKAKNSKIDCTKGDEEVQNTEDT